MGYKLADGSDSDLYRVGDTFVYSVDGSLAFIIRFDSLAGDFDQFVVSPAKHIAHWKDLTPTGDTKEKVREREMLSTEEGARRVSNSAKELADEVHMISKIIGLHLERSAIDKAAIDFKASKAPLASKIKKEAISQPNLKDKLIALKIGIVGNYGAASIVQEAIDAVSAEPLARIIDWRGGEEVKSLDFVVSNEFGVDYRAVVLEVISPTQIRTCRGLIGASHGNLTIIRINTAAIPKQRTMTKAEVEREFGVKVSD